jgi:dTDP-4-dehydrorhamnose reductase
MPKGLDIQAHDIDTLDITDAPAVQRRVEQFRPDWIINAAAYTAVDKAESDVALAYAINRDGAAYLAQAAQRVGARMLQVSTDFIFAGTQNQPYRTSDSAGPLGVYGASKLAGEAAAEAALGDALLILRTSWVYSKHGHNFVKTMLRLLHERDDLGVVVDQVGTPTWAAGLARAIWLAVVKNLSGIHHWTDAGLASWYDFACAIEEEAEQLGALAQGRRIRPILTPEYPTPARRPAYSVLDKTTTWRALDIARPVHWRVHLRHMLAELLAGE